MYQILLTQHAIFLCEYYNLRKCFIYIEFHQTFGQLRLVLKIETHFTLDNIQLLQKCLLLALFYIPLASKLRKVK